MSDFASSLKKALSSFKIFTPRATKTCWVGDPTIVKSVVPLFLSFFSWLLRSILGALIFYIDTHKTVIFIRKTLVYLFTLLVWGFAGDLLVHGANIFGVELCGFSAKLFIRLLNDTVTISTEK